MKKIYAVLVGLLLGSTSVVKAAPDYVLGEDTLQLEGLRVNHIYDFCNKAVDGEPLGEITYVDAGFSINKQGCVQFTTTGITNIFAFYGGNALQFRDGWGLYNCGSGGRAFAIGDLQKDQYVVIQNLDAQGRGLICDLVNTENAKDVSDSIHQVQTDAGKTPDNFFYFQMLENGRLDVSVGRGCCLVAAAILGDANAPEFITSPVLKLQEVYYEERLVGVTEGSSSYGSEVETYYSIDGSCPIYGDTIWVTEKTEDGRDTLVYGGFEPKPVDVDGTLYWGENLYDGSPITIDNSMPEIMDINGNVTVKAVTINKVSGLMSEVTSVPFNVGVVTLNAPTFTLVGVDDIYRDYTVNWTNNTLVGEPVSITVYANDEQEEITDVQLGQTIRVSSRISAVVQCAGYDDGTATLEELDQEGNPLYKKNDVASGLHNWDFLNLPDSVIQGIEGKIIDYGWYIDEATQDTVILSADDVINNPPSFEFTTEYKKLGWVGYDAGNSRATIEVLFDTIVQPVYDEDGVTIIGDTTIVTAYNAEDKTGLFHDGLIVDCPPNAKNNGTILMYTPKQGEEVGTLGLYFMSKGSITVPNVQYGEYVMFGFGKGGSNYITTTSTTCDMVSDTSGSFTKSIGAVTFVQYIDVFTADLLPDGIDSITDENSKDAIYVNVYSIDGRLVKSKVHVNDALNGLQKGIYIMNGKKYLVR